MRPSRILRRQRLDRDPAKGLRDTTGQSEMQRADRVRIGEDRRSERANLERHVHDVTPTAHRRLEALPGHKRHKLLHGIPVTVAQTLTKPSPASDLYRTVAAAHDLGQQDRQSLVRPTHAPSTLGRRGDRVLKPRTPPPCRRTNSFRNEAGIHQLGQVLTDRVVIEPEVLRQPQHRSARRHRPSNGRSRDGSDHPAPSPQPADSTFRYVLQNNDRPPILAVRSLRYREHTRNLSTSRRRSRGGRGSHVAPKSDRSAQRSDRWFRITRSRAARSSVRGRRVLRSPASGLHHFVGHVREAGLGKAVPQPTQLPGAPSAELVGDADERDPFVVRRLREIGPVHDSEHVHRITGLCAAEMAAWMSADVPDGGGARRHHPSGTSVLPT